MAKGKGGKGDRDILFRVGVSAHPESKKSLTDLGNAALTVQKNLDRSMASVSQSAKTAAGTISKGMVGSVEASGRMAMSTIQAMVATARAEMQSLQRMSTTVTARTTGQQLAAEVAKAKPPARVSDDDREADRLHDRHRARQQSIEKENRSAREADLKDAARAAREVDKEQERLHDRHRARQISLAKVNRLARDADAKDAARASALEDKEAERMHTRHRQRQLGIAKSNRAARDSEAREAASQLRVVESDYSRHVGKINAANEGMRGPLLGMTHAVGNVGRGFLQMGLLGEESTEQLLRGWVKIEAGFNVFTGVVQIVGNLSRVTTLWTRATEASKAASLLSTAASARQSVALAAETQAANAAALAHGRLSTARMAGARGGAASAASGAAAIGGTASGGVAIPAVGGAAVTFGAAVAAFVGAAAGIVSASSTFLQASKHGFGRGADQNSIAGRIGTAEAKGLAGAAGMLGNRGFDAATAMLGPATATGFFNPFKNLAKSNKQTASAEKRSARLRKEFEFQELNRQEDEEKSGHRAGLMQADYDARNRDRQFTGQMRMLSTPRESEEQKKIGANKRELDSTRRQLEDMPDPTSKMAKQLEARIVQLNRAQRDLATQVVSPELTERQGLNSENLAAMQAEKARLQQMQSQLALGAGNDGERKKATELIAQTEEHIRDLTIEQGKIKRQINDDQRRAAEEAMTSLQSEIDLRRAEARESRRKVEGAAESFGNMSATEQRKVLRLKGKSDAAADASLTVEEREKYKNLTGKAETPGGLTDAEQANLAVLRQKRAEASGAALSAGEHGALKSLGLTDDSAASKAGALQRGRKAGWDTSGFGRDDRADAGIATAAQRPLNIELGEKMEFVAKLDANVPEIAKEIVNQLMPLIATMKADLNKTVIAEFDARMAATEAKFSTARSQSNTARSS